MRSRTMLVGLIAVMAILVLVGCGGGGSGGISPNAFPTAGVQWNASGIPAIAHLESPDGTAYLTFHRNGAGDGLIKVYDAGALVASVPVGSFQKMWSLALRRLDLGEGDKLYLLEQYTSSGEDSPELDVISAVSGHYIWIKGAAACLAANFTPTDIVTTNDGKRIAGHLALPHF